MARDRTSLRVYRALLRAFPAPFRARFGDEMVQLFGDQLREVDRGARTGGAATTWARALRDLATTALAERLRSDRAVARSLSRPPSWAARALGLLGVAGGAALVAAFVPFLHWDGDIFNARLGVLNAGAIAIALAVYRREARVAPLGALAAATPVVLANAWHLVSIVRVVSQPGEPGMGDYGPTYVLALGSVWLSGVWFALLAARIGALARLGAVMLAAGSVLAFLPMLGWLDGPIGGTVDTLAIVGVASIGFAWMLLGIDVATRRTSVANTLD